MASILRQIVAGPRTKHQETGLDLCYVTSNIIATSGPSQTYPQRAYRNPLDRLVAFLDASHGSNWAIWEFRAEGTGYPDEAVYHRIRHYPWPDHHPPPFRLVPMIMASMRNWTRGGYLEGGGPPGAGGDADKYKVDEKRVIVIHCKAGKGRSGSMACSYLVSECGWTVDEALARFTERRMKPRFGPGVSIPSQLRWVGYVDRWTKGGKRYVDREVEVVEIHVWGLRHGVKVAVEGFVDEGKKIKVFHTFRQDERIVVVGDAPGGSGVFDLVSDMAGYGSSNPKVNDEDDGYAEVEVDYGKPKRTNSQKLKKSKTKIMGKMGMSGKESKSTDAAGAGINKLATATKSKTIAVPPSTDAPATSAPSLERSARPSSSTSSPNLIVPNSQPKKAQSDLTPPTNTSSSSNTGTSTPTLAHSSEPGGQAVIFKPAKPIRLPTSDINIDMERRNRAPGGISSMTMVTAVAHVWFNAYFEGNGPEQGGQADDSGVFEIEWDKMDGIKGSLRKGTRACDRIAVVWRSVPKGAEVIDEPAVGSPVPQMRPADWKQERGEDPEDFKRLGIVAGDRPDGGSEVASVASSISSKGEENNDGYGEDGDSLKGVKASGPEGEEELDAPATAASVGMEKGDVDVKKGFVVE